MWDLARTASLRAFVPRLADPIREAAVRAVLDEFDARVVPRQGGLKRQVIHADANDQNVIVEQGGHKVAGMIDFGDMVYTWRVNEVAVAAAYVLIALQYPKEGGLSEGALAEGGLSEAQAPIRPIAAIRALLKGYEAQLPLSETEWTVLPTLIACRIAMSLTMGAYSAALDPTNAYLRLTLEPGWKALQLLRRVPADRFGRLLRESAWTFPV